MAKKIIFLFSLITLLILGYTYRHQIKGFFREDNRTVNSVEVKLILSEEPAPDSLAVILERNGIVKSGKEVLEYIDQNGLQNAKFSAGKYIILPQTHMDDLVEGFIDFGDGHGKAEVKVNVLINHERDIFELAGNIPDYLLTDSLSLIGYMLNDSTLASLGMSKEELPSLFLPGKYRMYFDTDPKEFIAIMAKKYILFWNEERKNKLRKIGLKKPSEASTLASIIYSEQSQDNEEWPIIAGLYLNRLRQGIRLESDPTFRYCWGDELDGVERLLNKHKAIDCPYNTYLYEGLPPGPICIAPVTVIEAVLNPVKHDYIFMMAKPGGGGHNFASTNREHNRNVAEYRKWLREYLKNN